MTMRSLVKYAFCVLAAVISISAAGAGMPALMRLDIKDGKVIAEIPKSLLGCRLMMATRIEQTSDSGEGLSGQLSDNCISLVLSVEGKELVITMPQTNTLMEESSAPGVWKRYKVTTFKNDSTAVVDLTDLFQTQYSQLHTFPVKAYNSMGGQVRRVHKIQKDKSRFLSTDVRDSLASVLCDFYYKMDGYVMGMMKISGDYSVRAQVRKMLFLPPASSDFPAMKADPAVTANTYQRRTIPGPTQPVASTDYIRRWRVEPSDSAAWEAGEKVAPVRPIEFCLDTLIPENWVPYVKEGILAWNQAFEHAGFTSVIQVKEMPSEASFFSASPYLSRVIFAPSGMEQLETGDLYDSETGEIFSAQIGIHSNFIKNQHMELLKDQAAINPTVRLQNLPDSIAGRLVQHSVMKAVGKALGLREVTNRNKIALERMDLQNIVPEEYERKALAWIYGPSSCRSAETAIALAELLLPSNVGYFDELDQWTSNQKELFANLFDFFPDATTEFLVSLVTGVQDQYAKNIVKLLRFIGGSQKSADGKIIPYPSDLQSRAVKDVISHIKDIDWFKSVPEGRLPYGTNEFIGDVYRTNIFESLLKRYDGIKSAALSMVSGGYAPETFLKDISMEVFGSGRAAKTRLMPIEMVWQNTYVDFVTGKAAEDRACYKALLALRQQISEASVSARGEVADHYAYLLFAVDKKLNE